MLPGDCHCTVVRIIINCRLTTLTDECNKTPQKQVIGGRGGGDGGMGVIFSLTHTDVSSTTTLSSVCVHAVSHLTATISFTTAAAVTSGKMAE